MITEVDLLRDSLNSLNHDEIADLIASLDDDDARDLLYDWDLWARANQLAPAGYWHLWVILAGRGFGKTRSGAEWVRSEVESGRRKRIALVGATAADVRDVMIEGESGILACSHPDFMPVYVESRRRVTWPNGAVAYCYSAEEPRRLRGPQHDGFWADELCAWKNLDTWDQLLFGLRLGDDPRGVVTTTPMPIKLLKNILAETTTAITKGSTHENKANLAPQFFSAVVSKYEGTRLGRQELDAEILDDNPNALWKQSELDDHRCTVIPDLVRIVVAIDPAVTSGDEACDTGIIVAGKDEGDHGYVLADLTCHDSPANVARKAIQAYHDYHADAIVIETNQGGETWRDIIRLVADGEQIPIIMVHATRGKFVRAEPVSTLYEQGKIHHAGFFKFLEMQLCEWVPGKESPDRLDALVWAFTHLLVKEESGARIRYFD